MKTLNPNATGVSLSGMISTGMSRLTLGLVVLLVVCQAEPVLSETSFSPEFNLVQNPWIDLGRYNRMFCEYQGIWTETKSAKYGFAPDVTDPDIHNVIRDELDQFIAVAKGQVIGTPDKVIICK